MTSVPRYFDPRIDSMPILLQRKRPVATESEPRLSRMSYDELYPEGLDWDEDEAARPHSRVRRNVVRFVGGLAIGLSVLGLVQIALVPQARTAVLDWSTGGHSAEVEQAAHRAAAMFSHDSEPLSR